MSRCILLINRAAGASQRGHDPATIAKDVEKAFHARQHEITTRLVDPGDIERCIQQALKERPDVLLIGGGDGSVSAAAGLIAGTETALGILPMGTFNLAARDLGIPLDFAKAAEFLANAPSFPIDVLDVNGRTCLCSTIFGFYPEFSSIFENREANRGQWWRKAIGLISRVGLAFRKSRALRLSWESPAGSGTLRTKFSVFVPGSYRNAVGLIPARTEFTSGKLTAYLGRHRHTSAALRGMLDYSMGRQNLNPQLTVFSTPEITLRAKRRRHAKIMLDGEILKLRFPIRLRIRPRCLHVLGDPSVLENDPPPSA
ncbi:MAG: hypothetical protein MUF13_06190 [Akkermansiaceae bacterium]|jgi:diacylglycerol kinase family enzyme|nr:hypothetical protein [Akkermansiaceae bacterium]